MKPLIKGLKNSTPCVKKLESKKVRLKEPTPGIKYSALWSVTGASVSPSKIDVKPSTSRPKECSILSTVVVN